jgi:hypothetical protein
LSDALVSLRRLPSVVRTSGMSGPPSTISISPFGSAVTVGYQRPAAMFGPRLHVLVAGLKRCVWTMPSSRAFRLPPAAKIEPSVRCARPLQKMLNALTFTGVKAPVSGSKTVARV